MRKLRFISSFSAALAMLSFAPNSFASVVCPEAKVEHIYPTAEKIMVKLEGLDWHVLALNTDQDLNGKLATVKRSKAEGHFVQLTFPVGYPDGCTSSDKTVTATQANLIER